MAIMINNANRPHNIARNGMATLHAETAQKTDIAKSLSQLRESAAMLAINERLGSQIRGINHALNKANDGISIIQIAGQALDDAAQKQDKLRALAEQAADPATSASTRQGLHQEAATLREEMTSLVQENVYDDIKLLATDQPVRLQTGVRETDITTIPLEDLTQTLTAPLDLTTQEGGQTAVAHLQEGSERLGNLRANLDASHGSLVATLKDLTNSAKSITAAENRATDATLAEGIATKISSALRLTTSGTIDMPQQSSTALLQG